MAAARTLVIPAAPTRHAQACANYILQETRPHLDWGAVAWAPVEGPAHAADDDALNTVPDGVLQAVAGFVDDGGRMILFTGHSHAHGWTFGGDPGCTIPWGTLMRTIDRTLTAPATVAIWMLGCCTANAAAPFLAFNRAREDGTKPHRKARLAVRFFGVSALRGSAAHVMPAAARRVVKQDRAQHSAAPPSGRGHEKQQQSRGAEAAANHTEKTEKASVKARGKRKPLSWMARMMGSRPKKEAGTAARGNGARADNLHGDGSRGGDSAVATQRYPGAEPGSQLGRDGAGIAPFRSAPATVASLRPAEVTRALTLYLQELGPITNDSTVVDIAAGLAQHGMSMGIISAEETDACLPAHHLAHTPFVCKRLSAQEEFAQSGDALRYTSRACEYVPGDGTAAIWWRATRSGEQPCAISARYRVEPSPYLAEGVGAADLYEAIHSHMFTLLCRADRADRFRPPLGPLPISVGSTTLNLTLINGDTASAPSS